ncbi:hypothetical protein D0851_10110 [Marinobacter sp. Arc7-DN-1]|nr:hypothetical protein D0851_10110 [Marinobacter sp. Arc7-DN-1]
MSTLRCRSQSPGQRAVSVDSLSESPGWADRRPGHAPTGVETAAEYSVLCTLGIDGAMGYHPGRPFAADNQQTGD